MAALTFDSYSEARAHLKQVLDEAERGRPVLVRRDGAEAAVVDAERLRAALARLCPRAEVVAEAAGWSIFIAGLPVAGDAATFDEALDEVVDALREYAEDWLDRLSHAPNHRDNWGLVQLVTLSSDIQLKEWLAGSAP